MSSTKLNSRALQMISRRIKAGNTTSTAGVADPARTLVIGAVSDIPRVIEHPAIGSRTRLDVVAVVVVEPDSADVPAADILTLVATHGATTILVAGALSRNAMDNLGELAVTVACRLLLIMPAPMPTQHAPAIIWEDNHPLLQVAVGHVNGLQNSLKRFVECAISAVLLVALSPVIATAAVVVRLTSKGGAFFGHERVGRGGRRFRCWKIRTMSADAERQLLADPALHETYRTNGYKLPDRTDPRVTKVGHFLRRTSIDELPQLWNVLTGDMSLVGPRPLIADELKHYAGNVLTLLSVRPGVTGAWAVSGRHRLKYPYRAEVELDYVRNCTLRTDLMILVRTASALINSATDHS